jgi:hypothetical protein
MTRTFLATVLILAATALAADTYRWKDKDGNTHYGEAVPAEYADQPYDVINDAGLVIDRVEDTSVPLEVRQEQEAVKKERAPLISPEERARQYDRLLVIQYRSEEEITQALAFELAQFEYDHSIIEQSLGSTAKAIREQIAQAADQQRAGQAITDKQQQAIDKLYARLASDAENTQSLHRREEQIRERFSEVLERYRFLMSGDQETPEVATDQG